MVWVAILHQLNRTSFTKNEQVFLHKYLHALAKLATEEGKKGI